MSSASITTLCYRQRRQTSLGLVFVRLSRSKTRILPTTRNSPLRPTRETIPIQLLTVSAPAAAWDNKSFAVTEVGKHHLLIYVWMRKRTCMISR